MPLEIKLRNMQEKYVLREAAKPFITEEVYGRQKHPFLSPPESMNPDSPLYRFVQDTLRSDEVDRTGILDKRKVANLLDHLHELANGPGERVEVPKLVGIDMILSGLMSLVMLQRRFNPTL